ncbi:hypothetical protein IC762_17790 [Bradyrhizobium genosp. L]|uniref:phage tail fiber protein n=1 Tax=Bradyrhizobium genosp. L TaxID=83637 RepID=UPI0018A25D2B|nr:hypothetical protein [Bradyrhizobium genosp. L]QPF81677.1 hypothetical protein IC762_17790 [Bradyrhizobium genosp. L]
MTDITAANAILTLAIPGLFSSPQQIQGFSADDVYDLNEVSNVQAVMGVDGVLSGGFVWVPQEQSIVLQANSDSNAIFDTWNQNQKASQRTYPASGVLTLPSLGLKFVQSGGLLTTYKLPGAKKILTPRRFIITWEDVSPQPA